MTSQVRNRAETTIREVPSNDSECIMVEGVSSSTPFYQRSCNYSDSIVSRLANFKRQVDSEMASLRLRMSEQDQLITITIYKQTKFMQVKQRKLYVI